MAFRYKLTIEYDGTPYAGWQIQTDRMSVQEALQIAAQKFCGEAVQVVGAGRTDSGVHATAQVAHIDLPREIDAYRVMQGINYYLFNEAPNPVSHEVAAQDLSISEPDPVLLLSASHRMTSANRIAVIAAEAVSADFHARFSATKRRYLYRIINRRARLGLEHGRAWNVVEPLDEKRMQEAANLLVGHHDFSSFRDTQCQAKSPIKTLEELTIKRFGSEIHITTSGRSFLHHQVRIMTGTLALVGKGRWSVSDVQKALDAKTRSAAGLTAPPEGLYLVGVEY